MSRRRTYLRAVGLAGAGLLAGCQTDGEGTPANETATATPTEDTFDGEQVAKVTADDGAADDAFGSELSLSADGTTALVTAPDEGDTNESGDRGAGAAYVFDRTDGEWEQTAKLTPDDGQADDDFGQAGAISANGETVLVGDEFADDERADTESAASAGAAFVFVRDGDDWIREAKLQPPAADEVLFFGSGLALDSGGDVALVGAPGATVDGTHGIGATYVAEREDGEWSVSTRVTGSQTDRDDDFGQSVALEDDATTALVGAPTPSWKNSSGTSVAYVFTDSDGSWTEQTTLTPEDADVGDQFGYAVALDESGQTALVGAYNDADPNGSVEMNLEAGGTIDAGAGSATDFKRTPDEWTRQQRLTADDGDGGDYFGFSVALSADGTSALVGAVSDEDPNGRGDDAVSGAGSAYLFDDEWQQQAKLAADDGDSFDGFGSSVALAEDGGSALVGAVGDEDPHGGEDDYRYWNGGSAYAFE